MHKGRTACPTWPGGRSSWTRPRRGRPRDRPRRRPVLRRPQRRHDPPRPLSTPNQAPTAAFTATTTSGAAAADRQLLRRAAPPTPTRDSLTYAWDLDGDGVFDDATGVTASRTYTTRARHVRLRVTEPAGSRHRLAEITVGTPPAPVIQPGGGSTSVVGATDLVLRQRRRAGRCSSPEVDLHHARRSCPRAATSTTSRTTSAPRPAR